MIDDIKDKLNEEISSELDALTKFDVGSDDYKTAVECISKLIDKQNDIDKIELEVAKHKLSERKDLDKMAKENELNENNKKNQLINYGITIGSILIPVFVTIWGTYKTFEFEKTGTVTTIMGRGFINKLIPKK